MMCCTVCSSTAEHFSSSKKYKCLFNTCAYKPRDSPGLTPKARAAWFAIFKALLRHFLTPSESLIASLFKDQNK